MLKKCKEISLSDLSQVPDLALMEIGSMLYLKQLSRIAIFASATLIGGYFSPQAKAATLDVCATCTHTTLDSAFAAASQGDTIVLDGPTSVTDPATVYTLSSALVINDSKEALEIRGRTESRPDQIEIVGPGGGPVFTVEEENSFKLRGVAIKGGTTGVLAMKDSDVEIRRVLFEGISGISVNCIEPANVYLAGSVITGSGDDAVRIDQGGRVEILQCTLITNSGLGVNAIDGSAHIVATLIHDSGAGIDGTSTTLEVRGNWVTDASGAPQPMPTGVSDPDAVTDTLIYADVFETVVEPFPGKLLDATQERSSGLDSADLSQNPFSMSFTGLDFDGEARNGGDLIVGADESNGLASVAAWTECIVVQNGYPRRYVGEGVITIYITAANIDLSNSSLYIKHEDVTDITALGAQFIGPLNITTESTIDTNYGYVDYTVSEDDFAIEFPPPFDLQKDYLIYLHTDRSAPVTDVSELHGTSEGTPEQGQAVDGRVFGLDTVPPVIVTNALRLADQYATAATLSDGGAIDPGPWSAATIATLLGDAGANAGYMNGNTGEPAVFLDGVSPLANVGLALTFTDEGSGFALNGLPSGRIETTVDGKRRALYRDYQGLPGFAWWDSNGESDTELISSVANLTVSYTNSGGNTLQTVWNFANLIHDGLTQWHAIANIRVMDLAGNEATLDPSFENFIPLRPFHFWWFPQARGEFRSGPSFVETTNPVFTWNMFRYAGGEDPRDPLPCFSSVRWRLWGANAPGVLSTTWTDLTGGGWSVWMSPLQRSITLDTYFDATTRLRDLMTGPVGSEYLIALQGYDEAGNLQVVPPLGNLTSTNDLAANGIDFRRWTNPGLDTTLALDTKVQARFWYNPGNGNRNRTLDIGERDFGSATRIPLPADSNQRIEAGFNLAMELPANVPAGATVGVYYEVFEDGRLVASGYIDPNSAPPGQFHFAIPSDILFGAADVPGWLIPTDATADDLFLNQDQSGVYRDRLGDDGPIGAEPPHRQRDVKYQILFATQVNAVRDSTPATVDFTVTVDRGLKEDQPVKRFVKE